MAATKIVKKAQKVAKSASRTYKKFDGDRRDACVKYLLFNISFGYYALILLMTDETCRVGDALWLPNTQRPAWLDGSLPGDRGFDPLGLAKPAEYLQVNIFLTHTLTSHWFSLAQRETHDGRG